MSHKITITSSGFTKTFEKIIFMQTIVYVYLFEIKLLSAEWVSMMKNSEITHFLELLLKCVCVFPKSSSIQTL